MGNNLYFCNVKSIERYEAAAIKQRFLCPINGNSKRIVCGSSNAHKVSARLNLTTRNALSFLMSN